MKDVILLNDSISHRDEEIDLIELVLILFKKKLKILIITSIVFILFVIYAFTKTPIWTSTLTISQPLSFQNSNYSIQVHQLASLFPNDSQEILTFNSTDYLFKTFIRNFSSDYNKREFLLKNNIINDLFKNKKLTSPEQVDSIISSLSKNIIISNNKQSNSVTNSIKSSTRDGSFKLLNGYIKYISSISSNQIIKSLIAEVKGYKTSLIENRNILIAEAKEALNINIIKDEYALSIANAANLDNPVKNLYLVKNSHNNSDFDFQLGAKVLKSRLNILKSIKDFSIVNPEISKINSKLLIMDQYSIDNSSLLFFDKKSPLIAPLVKTSPHRGLLMTIGLLAGLILSLFFVLIHDLFLRKK